MKKIVIPSIVTLSIIGALSYFSFSQKDEIFQQDTENGIIHYASNTQTNLPGQPVDFSAAAEQTVKNVVHITTRKEAKEDDYYSFFGMQAPEKRGSGSGVIISQDGYIVTNNHVVQGMDEVKVTFHNKVTKTAKVIGTDPSTDLAVLKIEGSNYPYVIFGNSDDVKLGQWVLAVGYPFNLDATVTAGIVSAKSRHIGINRRQSNVAIESFIQTDAAVNMGNSGGALVNTNGHLIGINSAIATPTGAYAGYSYAIPSNLVRKVAKDLIEHGQVKRGFMGASLADAGQLNERSAQQFGLSINDYANTSGVLLADVVSGGGADNAGLKKGDIITSINGKEVNTSSQLMEQIAMYYPGDEVKVSYKRKGNVNTATVALQSQDALTKVATKHIPKNDEMSSAISAAHGLTLSNLSKDEMNKYKINGVKVVSVDPSGLIGRMTGIEEGFVITKINGKEATSASQVEKELSSGKRISIAGTYPGTGSSYSFSFGR